MKNMKNEEKNIESIKKAGDGDIKLSDLRKQFDDFIKDDEKRDILLFEMIAQADREQAEMLECLLLKTFDVIQEKSLKTALYNNEDLETVNFFLGVVKFQIAYELSDHEDLSPVNRLNGMGVVNL